MMEWLQDDRVRDCEICNFYKSSTTAKTITTRNVFIYTRLYAKRVASCGEDDEEEEVYVSKVTKPMSARKYVEKWNKHP